MSGSADASPSGSGHAGQGSVWVFNGLGANGQHHVWPAAVFTTYQKATAWVASAGVHGTLTEMPLDESTYEHAVRTGRFNPREPVDRVLLQTFSSSLEHEHYLPDTPRSRRVNVPDPELSRQVRELLLARDAPNERLRRLISLLDSSASMVLLTQMVVALGRVLVAKHRWADDHPVVATVRAGQRYSEDPTPEHYRDYFESATSSYPFGTGDGCYAMEGSRDCTIGTGCPSGSGTLESIAQDLGADVVLQVLRDEKVSRGGW